MLKYFLHSTIIDDECINKISPLVLNILENLLHLISKAEKVLIYLTIQAIY